MRIVLNAIDMPPNMKFAARIIGWPFSLLGRRGDRKLPPVLRAMNSLGPAYVKFGQLLSTRPDLVGSNLANELRALQDNLAPFSTEIAKKTVESELGIKIDEVFSEFGDPVAAASVAQVHRARLKKDGSEVAVKILRPDIEREFFRDIESFYFVAWLARMFSPTARRLRITAIVEHFEGIVLRELDLRMEASAADEFTANAAQDADVTAPAVIWELSRKRVLTSEWVKGTNLGNVEELKAAGHDLNDIAFRLVQMFLRQALRDGYFHADLHQGNLKVSKTGEIVALDFGIMGRIDGYTRRVYAEILYGFVKRNYRAIAKVHFEAGYVPRNQNLDDFTQALRSIGEPIFGMDSSRISMARLLGHLFDVTERFKMETRTELILLQRTMVVVEGVARSLDPKINIWEASRPIVEDYILTHVGPVAMIQEFATAVQAVSRLGPRLSELNDAALNYLDRLGEHTEPKSSLSLASAFFYGFLSAAVIVALIVLL